MAHVMQQAWNANIAMLLNCQKRIHIKNIKYIMLKHYKQEHLSSAYNTGAAIKDVQLMIECNSTISTKSHSNLKSNEPSTIVSSLTSVDLSTNTYPYHHFNHFDSPPNQMYFFLNMFHPFCGGAHGIVWRALTRTGSFSTIISTVEATQVFFKTYNQFQQAASKYCINLMKLLHMTVKQSNVNNNVLCWLPGHDKDIYKLFIGGKHSIKATYQYQLHSILPIQHAFH